MDIAVLGPLEVEGSGTLNRRDRMVLETLASQRGQSVTAGQLIDVLWGETPPPSAPKNLQGCIVRLRKRLGREAITTTSQGYRLEVAADELDVGRFEGQVARARELLTLGEPDRAAYQATTALDLWRGDPFPDLDGWDPVTTERARLEELRLEAEELRVEAHLQTGRHLEVLADARSMVRAAPLREQRWLLLARAQYQAGQQGEALRTLHQLKGVLTQQLGIDPGPGVSELETAILRQELPTAGAALLTDARATCPYQGLMAYDVGDADRFFGRSHDVTACLAVLSRSPLLALVGPSGSGKSSLLNAGIVAALRGRGRPSVRITPTARPMLALAALDQAKRDAVLVVDQAEELFTLCEDAEQRTHFVERLVAETATRSVVLGLRADRLADLAAYPTVSRLVEQGLYLVGALDEVGLREAVEGPARQSGLLVEPGLSDLLVREVRDDPGALPLLSHALQETWRRREGNTLTVTGYRDSGGIQGAIAQSAEHLYAQLEPDHRLLLRDLVLRLVSPGGQGEAVRSRVPRRVVAPDDARSALIERLVAARLVTSDEGVLEITHEALARAWPRLRGWLDDDVDGQRMLHHLAGAADAWESLGRPDSELYRGIRLARALDWHEQGRSPLTEVEQDFLDASRSNAEAERRSAEEHARLRERMIGRLRGALSVAAALLVLAVVAGLLAWQQQRAAEENAAAAEDSAAAAMARRAGALSLVSEDLDQTMLLAAAGVALDDSTDTRFNVLAAIQRFPRLFRTTRVPGSRGMRAVAASPDGSTLAALDADSTLRLVDFASGQVLKSRTLGEGPGSQAFDHRPPLVFSPDGRYVAAAAAPLSGRPLALLDAATFEPVRPGLSGLPESGHVLTDATFSTDGRYLTAVVQRHEMDPRGASSPTRSRALLWDLETGGPPRSFRLDDSWPQSAVLNNEADVLLTGPPLVRHDLRAGTSEQLAEPNVADLAPSPTGDLVAGSSFWTLVLLDPDTGEVLHRLGQSPDGAAVRFSPDGRRVAAMSFGEREVTIWNVARREPRVQQRFALGRGLPDAFDFSADGSRLYAAEGLDAVRHWDLDGARGLLARENLPPRPPAGFAVVAPGGGHEVFLDEGGFTLRDLETGETTEQVPFGEGYRHTYGAWHPDGEHFASAIAGVVTVRQLVSGEVVRRTRLPDEMITEIDYSPDGSRLMVSHQSGRVLMLDGASLEAVGTPVDVGEEVSFVSASPDNRTAVVLTGGPAEDGLFRQDATGWAVVDLEAGEVLRRGDSGLGAAVWLAHSPDGRHFAIGGGDESEKIGATGSKGELVVFDARTGEQVQAPTAGHASSAYHVAYSPDGRQILSSSLDGTVALWDALTGRLLARVEVEGRPFISAEFLPDGESVRIAEWGSGRAYTWDLDTDRALRLACDMAGRELSRDEWRSIFGDWPYQRVCDR
ncbi:BTAD domain-containing putative transcriptional regulator [Nocardioides coralli]|uniref:nSTAND1 domain-containing NTPase n=1 Tax=Nocardioides coralli TaxID=2872154 RepID=UPI001CA45F76|nr:BTAD domain-containing putative transcriptional regulator [Nocardioides coralli]QZY28402.1 winged helix-turn-helix domain-containing protein [Nocardioides coralli]